MRAYDDLLLRSAGLGHDHIPAVNRRAAASVAEGLLCHLIAEAFQLARNICGGFCLLLRTRTARAQVGIQILYIAVSIRSIGGRIVRRNSGDPTGEHRAQHHKRHQCRKE